MPSPGHFAAAAGVLLALLAQQSAAPPSPPPCRTDHTVDEYIAEIHKEKKKRNKNPLPSEVCLGGWCKGKAEKPPPQEAPPQPSSPPAKPESAAGESSSREGAAGAAPEQAPAYDPFAAAESTEVGDYYFSEKKYRAALSRYQEALDAKPDDPAILLRLGRTFENLDEPLQAFESYDASLAADSAGPSAEVARRAAERLRAEVEKRGEDPAAISARNHAHIVPRCPAPAAPSPR